MTTASELNLHNPAHRLLRIVQKAKGSNKNAELRHVWASTFEVPKNDNAALVRCLSDALDLVQHVADELDRTPAGSDAFRRRAQVEAALAHPNLTTPWHQVSENLSEATIIDLQHVGDALDRYRVHWGPSEDRVDSLADQLRETIDQIIKEDLDDDLKIFVIDQLNSILSAVHRFKIVGVQGLRKAAAAAVAEVQTKPNAKERVEKSGAGKKALALIHAVAMMTALSADVDQLTAPQPRPAIQLNIEFEVPKLPGWPEPNAALMPPSADAKQMPVKKTQSNE